MKKIRIVGVAFAAVFAVSMVSASGASAFTLWDECMEINLATEVGLFNDADCLTLGGTEDWEWLEITTATPTDSLPTTLTLESNGVRIDCEGSVDGTVGPGAKDETTEILNNKGEKLELGLRGDSCTLLADPLGLCNGAAGATAYPEHLPWVSELTANGDLLGPHAGGENPGWFIECGNPLKTNLCTRADTFLTVENLTDELEVDLGFKTLEEATCTEPMPFGSKGKVEGTVSILLGGTPERALQAM